MSSTAQQTPWSPPPDPSLQGATTDFDYASIPAGYYDDIFRAERGVQSKWHHIKFACLRQLLSGYRNHLDIGCGSGTFIGTLDHTHQSVGVDIASAQIDVANARYRTSSRSFVLVPPGRLPFPDDKFDAVTTVELVEHLSLDESLALLREAVRTLRPGGRLIASTPNYRSVWPLIELAVNRFGGVSYEHQHITKFTRNRLQRLLQDAGLVDVNVCAYMFVAPFTAFLGWHLADSVERYEPSALVRRCGLLLCAWGSKR